MYFNPDKLSPVTQSRNIIAFCHAEKTCMCELVFCAFADKGLRMPRTVTHKPDSPNNDDVLVASEEWDACKPLYQLTHENMCCCRQNYPLSLRRRPPFQIRKENYLRIDFSKAGKVTFYAEFPKRWG